MSMFTKRHYIWLASVARDMHLRGKETSFPTAHAISILAAALESESEGFDRDLFMKNVYSPILVETQETTSQP